MLGPKKRAERIVATLKECREKTEAEIVRLRADLTKANATIVGLREGVDLISRQDYIDGEPADSWEELCNEVDCVSTLAYALHETCKGARALLTGSSPPRKR